MIETILSPSWMPNLAAVEFAHNVVTVVLLGSRQPTPRNGFRLGVAAEELIPEGKSAGGEPGAPAGAGASAADCGISINNSGLLEVPGGLAGAGSEVMLTGGDAGAGSESKLVGDPAGAGSPLIGGLAGAGSPLLGGFAGAGSAPKSCEANNTNVISDVSFSRRERFGMVREPLDFRLVCVSCKLV